MELHKTRERVTDQAIELANINQQLMQEIKEYKRAAEEAAILNSELEAFSYSVSHD